MIEWHNCNSIISIIRNLKNLKNLTRDVIMVNFKIYSDYPYPYLFIQDLFFTTNNVVQKIMQ
jgi:hypothetical protein